MWTDRAADSRKSGGVTAWTETIGAHIKRLDPRHLYLDTSGIFRSYAKAIDNPSIDLVSFEEYPHWDAVFNAVVAAYND